MFIRKKQKKDTATGKSYFSFQLVESIRTERGPRQRILLNLGQLDLQEEEYKLLADRIEEIVTKQGRLFECPKKIESLAQSYASQLINNLSKPSTNEKPTATIPDYVTIDLNSFSHAKARTVGTEHLLLETAKRMKIPEILKALNFSEKQVKVALASIIARAAFPSSERATYSRLIGQSGLGELLQINFETLSLNQLYKISDQLLKNKPELEQHISQSQKEMHGVTDTIILYDLTNTYFEGNNSGNSKSKHGVSKEKRSDCPLVTLGLVLNQSGFLIRSAFLPGNISEPKTLKEAVTALGSKDDLLKPTIAMDAGIATEENLNWLIENNYTYVVSSRSKKAPAEPSGEVTLVGKDVKNPVKLQESYSADGKEKWLHCNSPAKEAKASEMKTSFSKRFELDMERARSALSKPQGTKKFHKVLERIGRIKEKHRAIASCYNVEVTPSEDGEFVREITWDRITDKFDSKLSGTYYLRSNLIDNSAQELWELYHSMQVVENAFRFMKSSLGMRPVYHQKEGRVDGHLWITILAYSLIQDILFRLKSKGINFTWETLRTHFNSRVRVTSQAKNQEKKVLHFRSTTEAEMFHLQIYEALEYPSAILNSKKVLV
tara:strand:+ start:199 stop:2019 length:1821 start_codon:yes stop_codon:yes gene_type:complete